MELRFEGPADGLEALRMPARLRRFELGLSYGQVDRAPRVLAIDPQGPLAREDLEVGDEIAEITYEEGDAGARVSMSIVRGEAERTFGYLPGFGSPASDGSGWRVSPTSAALDEPVGACPRGPGYAKEDVGSMRTGGHVLLWIGVLGGAFVAVRDPSAVAWSAYLVMALVAVIGVVLLRRTARAAQGTSQQIERRMDVLRDALVQADDVLGALHAEASEARESADFDVYAVHERLDARLAAPLAAFADGREAMIPALGMTTYGEVMTRFAAAERLVNRTWSASADGYIDEVRTCLGQARELMGQARQTFETASQAAAGGR